MSIILAIDPGETTGYAVFEYTETDPATLFEYGEIPGGLQVFMEWWQQQSIKFDVLVAEDFILRGGVKLPNTTALRILGFLAPYAPVLQPPAGRKKAVSDDVLKRLGMYLPGKQYRNAREAVRHGVWYLKRQQHLPTLQYGWAILT